MFMKRLNKAEVFLKIYISNLSFYQKHANCRLFLAREKAPCSVLKIEFKSVRELRYENFVPFGDSSKIFRIDFLCHIVAWKGFLVVFDKVLTMSNLLSQKHVNPVLFCITERKRNPSWRAKQRPCYLTMADSNLHEQNNNWHTNLTARWCRLRVRRHITAVKRNQKMHSNWLKHLFENFPNNKCLRI